MVYTHTYNEFIAELVSNVKATAMDCKSLQDWSAASQQLKH